MRKQTRVPGKQARHPYREGDTGAHQAMQPRRELGTFLFVEVMGKREFPAGTLTF